MNVQKFLLYPVSLFLFLGVFNSYSYEFSYEIYNLERSAPVSEYILGAYVGRDVIKLGVFANTQKKPTLVLVASSATEEVTNFTDFLRDALSQLKANYSISIKKACFGVPGNANESKTYIQAPHLSFPVDGNEMIQQGLLETVAVLNDFEVQGYGVESLDEQKVVQINAGKERKQAPKIILGAGTGLGSTLMVWNDAQQVHNSLPLGACFMDFTPHNQDDLNFRSFLKKRLNYEKCSWGNALGSTGGIWAAYDYFHQQMTSEEAYAAHLDTIFAKRDPICAAATDYFLTLYARLIRNMLYAVLPYGGLYLTNDLVMNYSSLFTAPEFVEEILRCDHEFLKAIVAEIPMYVVTDNKLGLYGAAQYITNTSRK